MPIYEYRCGTCGSVFEKLTFRSDEAVECTKCRGTDVEKLLSAFAVGGSAEPPPPASPCGDCGAARRGMCSGLEA